MKALGVLAAATVALFLVLVFAVHAFAITSEEATAYAREAGFPGTVLVQESERPNGGYYRLAEVILLEQPVNFPDQWMRVILYHEIGHYLQDLDGTLTVLAPIERERDADLRGARLGCAHGVKLEDAVDLWTWVVLWYGDGAGSLTHGSRIDRVRNLLRAGAPCEHAEAAFLAPYRS